MYYVYLLTNQTHRVLYVGITNNLQRRLFEHRQGLIDGFTKKYKVYKLIYFETTTDVRVAIAREKQIKGWTRAKKNTLIATLNAEWKDLGEEILQG